MLREHMASGTTAKLAEFIPAGDRAVVGLHVHWGGEWTGTDDYVYQVITMRDGSIVRIQEHASRTDALKSVR